MFFLALVLSKMLDSQDSILSNFSVSFYVDKANSSTAISKLNITEAFKLDNSRLIEQSRSYQEAQRKCSVSGRQREKSNMH